MRDRINVWARSLIDNMEGMRDRINVWARSLIDNNLESRVKINFHNQYGFSSIFLIDMKYTSFTNYEYSSHIVFK